MFLNLKFLSILKLKKLHLIAFVIFLIIFSIMLITLSYKMYQFAKQITIEEIVIYKASPEVKKELESRLMQLKGKKVFDLKLVDLQKYINSLPWIEVSSLRRELTGKLEITVLEKNPYFLWQDDDGKHKLIASDNTVVKTSPKINLDNFIIIEKGDLALTRSSNLRFIIYQDLKLLKEISKLQFNGYRWDIVLKNGLIIKMPENNLEDAYKKIILMHKKYDLFGKDIAYIDATSINKLFIMPNER